MPTRVLPLVLVLVLVLACLRLRLRLRLRLCVVGEREGRREGGGGGWVVWVGLTVCFTTYSKFGAELFSQESLWTFPRVLPL